MPMPGQGEWGVRVMPVAVVLASMAAACSPTPSATAPDASAGAPTPSAAMQDPHAGVPAPAATVQVASAGARANAQEVAAGKRIFQSTCGLCHSPQPGRNEIGPSLFGVVGRHSGQVPGFAYSAAN